MPPSAVLISAYANLEHYFIYCDLTKGASIEDVRWTVFTCLDGDGTYTDYDREQLPGDDDERRSRCNYEEPFATAMGLDKLDEKLVPHFWAYEIGLDDFGPTPPLEATKFVILMGDSTQREGDRPFFTLPVNDLSK